METFLYLTTKQQISN